MILIQYKKERRISPKIEKLRASDDTIWAKVNLLRFVLFLQFKNKLEKYFLSY